MAANTSTKDREIVITRLVNAPRELVWQVCTEPEHIVHWWGPNGFTNTIKQMEVKPGGVWLFTMHGPDGTDYKNKIEYREVVKPERLSYLHSDPDSSNHFEASITFEEKEGKTLVTLTTVFPTVEDRDFAIREIGAIEGGTQTLSKLEQYVLKIS